MIEQYFQLKYMQEMFTIIVVAGMFIFSFVALLVAYFIAIYKIKHKYKK